MHHTAQKQPHPAGRLYLRSSLSSWEGFNFPINRPTPSLSCITMCVLHYVQPPPSRRVDQNSNKSQAWNPPLSGHCAGSSITELATTSSAAPGKAQLFNPKKFWDQKNRLLWVHACANACPSAKRVPGEGQRWREVCFKSAEVGLGVTRAEVGVVRLTILKAAALTPHPCHAGRAEVFHHNFNLASLVCVRVSRK